MAKNNNNDYIENIRPTNDAGGQQGGNRVLTEDGIGTIDCPAYDPFEPEMQQRFEKDLLRIKSTPNWESASWNPSRYDGFSRVTNLCLTRLLVGVEFYPIWEKTVVVGAKRMVKLTIRTRNFGSISVEIPWDLINDDYCPADLPMQLASAASKRVRNNIYKIKEELLRIEKESIENTVKLVNDKLKQEPVINPTPSPVEISPIIVSPAITQPIEISPPVPSIDLAPQVSPTPIIKLDFPEEPVTATISVPSADDDFVEVLDEESSKKLAEKYKTELLKMGGADEGSDEEEEKEEKNIIKKSRGKTMKKKK